MLDLTDTQRQTLAAALDRFVIINEDGALPTGPDPALLATGLTLLEEESNAVFGAGFGQLHPEQQDELLARLQEGNNRIPWAVPPQDFFTALTQLAARQ